MNFLSDIFATYVLPNYKQKDQSEKSNPVEYSIIHGGNIMADTAENEESTSHRSPIGSPSKHPLVGEDPGDEDKDSAYSCQRFILSIIFMPLFLIICLLGMILWILMIPFLLCCPRDGCYANIVTDVYEHTVMAPWRACRWASTKRSINKALQNHTTKNKKYGGTEDPENGTKPKK